MINFILLQLFLDLSKAFNTCNKDIMVKKLKSLGFRGVVADWLEGYMTDRRLIIDIAGVRSEAKTVNLGLPQGSVSSPYLFSIYVR